MIDTVRVPQSSYHRIHTSKQQRQHRTIKLLCIVSYLSGLLYLYYLPLYPQISQNIYVDENSLLPGNAVTGIKQHIHIRNMKLLQKSYDRHINNNNSNTNTITPWLINELQLYHNIGVYEYNDIITYTVLQPNLVDNKHVIVLITPYVSVHTPSPHTIQSHVLLTQLLQYLSNVQWLSCNVMLITVKQYSDSIDDVIYSRDELNNFLHIYRTNTLYTNTSSPYSSINRYGIIQAALVIDLLNKQSFDSISIDSFGTYGLLSNLDIVSTSTTVLQQYNLPITVCQPRVQSILHNTLSSYIPQSTYFNQIHTGILNCMFTAISPQYTYHSYLVSHNIDALTWTGHTIHQNINPYNHELNVYRLSAATDSWIRSISNTHEKLHHSTWLYLLNDQYHFTTMNKYIYALVFIVISLPLYSFYSLYKLKSDQDNVLHNGSSVLLVYCCSIGIGIIIHNLTVHNIIHITAVWSILLIIASIVITQLYDNINIDMFRLAQTLTYGPITVLNFTYTALLAIITVPLSMLLCHQYNNKLIKLIQQIICILLMPCTVLTAAILYTSQSTVQSVLLQCTQHDIGLQQLLYYGIFVIVQPVYILCCVNAVGTYNKL